MKLWKTPQLTPGHKFIWFWIWMNKVPALLPLIWTLVQIPHVCPVVVMTSGVSYLTVQDPAGSWSFSPGSPAAFNPDNEWVQWTSSEPLGSDDYYLQCLIGFRVYWVGGKDWTASPPETSPSTPKNTYHNQGSSVLVLTLNWLRLFPEPK